MTSPLTALVSYLILDVSGLTQENPKRNIGILLLISSGTFLYVATMHILPAGSGDDGHDHSNMGGEVTDKNETLR